MSGGAGYVLTREAIRRFVEIGISETKTSKQRNGKSGKSNVYNNSICAFNPDVGEDVNLGIGLYTQD